MKVLVLNSGSSSLKFTLFEMTEETVLIGGSFERIGLPQSVISFQAFGGPHQTISANIPNHGTALDALFETLTAGPISALQDIPAVAHRLGHGGKYRETKLIDIEVMDEIRKVTPFFPLHYPAMILEIEECMKKMPQALHVAVFDCSFHRDIPDEAAIYGLPYRFFSEKGYKRIGYHGNSHAFSAIESSNFLGRPLEQLRIITLHLGNGSSSCAIRYGKSIDTTMGVTTVEGLIMGTRSGDVDPGLIPFIMDDEKLSTNQISDMLVHHSGLLGISGLSRDMREIEKAAGDGNERAKLALNAFCYKAKRSIGSMLIALGGCNVLVFTGGIGINSSTVRSKCLEGTEELGFMIDNEKNLNLLPPTMERPVAEISSQSSPVRILVIRANEEIMMARECYDLAKTVLQI
ncbi:MAG: acetate/propionate family kinase [Pseudomonadota bacterium]